MRLLSRRWAILGVLIAARGAVAQTLAGTVSDAGIRVPGAIVLLLDSDGRVAARAVSRESGEYSVSASKSGKYSLRVLRIGYTPTLAGPFELRTDNRTTADITLSGHVQPLPEVRITDKSLCEVRPDSLAAAFRLWDEARTALMATALTAGEALTVQLSVNDRVVDRTGKRVIADSTSTKTGAAIRPFVSLPADSLARVGYVTRDRTGMTLYWGPDADVLLSESFATGHCIRTALPAADTGRFKDVVGVGFESATKRGDIADIAGVLWLDRHTAELRWLDYHYVNVPSVVAEADAGGHIEFLRFGSRWFTNRWTIRYPVVETTNSPGQSTGLAGIRGPDRSTQRVTGIKMTTGDILAVRRGSTTLWERGRVSFAVRVSDSTSGLQGILVSLAGSGSEVATGADGIVRFDRVVPGNQVIELRAAWFDSLGLGAARLPIVVPDRPTAPVVVTIPSPTAAFAAKCGRDALEWQEGLVRALVPGSATAGAPPTLEVSWQMPYHRLGGGEPVLVSEKRRLAPDTVGGYSTCGVPRNVPLTVRLLTPAGPPLTRSAHIPRDALAALVSFRP